MLLRQSAFCLSAFIRISESSANNKWDIVELLNKLLSHLILLSAQPSVSGGINLPQPSKRGKGIVGPLVEYLW